MKNNELYPRLHLTERIWLRHFWLRPNSPSGTPHIPGTLSEMPAVALMEDDKDVEFG